MLPGVAQVLKVQGEIQRSDGLSFSLTEVGLFLSCQPPRASPFVDEDLASIAVPFRLSSQGSGMEGERPAHLRPHRVRTFFSRVVG